MYYTGFKVAVIYDNKDWAEEWLMLFKERIDDVAIQCIKRMGRGRFEITMRDGTKIKSASTMDDILGEQFDKMFVEPCIPLTGEFFTKKFHPMIYTPIVIHDREYYDESIQNYRRLSQRQSEQAYISHSSED